MDGFEPASFGCVAEILTARSQNSCRYESLGHGRRPALARIALTDPGPCPNSPSCPPALVPTPAVVPRAREQGLFTRPSRFTTAPPNGKWEVAVPTESHHIFYTVWTRTRYKALCVVDWKSVER